MSWRQTDAMQERRRMIEDYLSGLYSKTELAERYGVSRPTIDLWIARFKEAGFPGLADRSHAPRQCPHRTAGELEQLIIATRQAHPTWGPRMIRERLCRKDPGLGLPAASTIGDILRRAGLIVAKPKRRASHVVRINAPAVSAPNQIWNIDFKGQHRLQNRQYVYPLTVTDAYSRFLLCCQGYPSIDQLQVQQQLTAIFAEHGLPEMIRSDNGAPFAGNGLWKLSRLRLWWMKLGIVHLLIRPGRPQENGLHERYHRTQKAETVFPIAADIPEQQRRYDVFRHDYNDERPHQGINGATPSELYLPSQRRMPSEIPPPEYPGHFEPRRVSVSGSIKLGGQSVFLSETLAGQTLGLEPIDDGTWAIHFYATELGRLDSRTMQVR